MMYYCNNKKCIKKDTCKHFAGNYKDVKDPNEFILVGMLDTECENYEEME